MSYLIFYTPGISRFSQVSSQGSWADSFEGQVGPWNRIEIFVLQDIFIMTSLRSVQS